MKEKFLRTLRNIVRHHGIYLWGAQGELVIDLTYYLILKMETSQENANRVERFIETLNSLDFIDRFTKAFDCSGLICFALVKCGLEKKGFDVTANDLFKRYPKTTNLCAGCLLHREGHIACYIGHNHLIEAKGRDYGVVISPFYKEEWDAEYAYPFDKAS